MNKIGRIIGLFIVAAIGAIVGFIAAVVGSVLVAWIALVFAIVCVAAAGVYLAGAWGVRRRQRVREESPSDPEPPHDRS